MIYDKNPYSNGNSINTTKATTIKWGNYISYTIYKF